MNKKNITKLILLTYFIQLIQLPLAQADVTSVATGNAVVDCSSFCQKFSQKGLTSDTWGTNDDALCNALGQTTSDNSSITAIPYATATATMAAASNGTDWLDKCKYHGKQVEQYCWAYNSINGSGGTKDKADGARPIEAFMITLDAAAVSACTAACFAGGNLNVALNSICAGAAAAESIAELVGSQLLQDSNTSKAVTASLASMGAVGAAGTARNASLANNKNKGNKLMLSQAKNDSANAAEAAANAKEAKKGLIAAEEELKAATLKINDIADHEENLDDLFEVEKAKDKVKEATAAAQSAEKTAQDAENIAKGAKDAAQDAEAAAKEADFGSKNSEKNKEACGTAVMMAVLLGIRSYNLHQLNSISDDSCQQINNLATSTDNNGKVTNSNGNVVTNGNGNTSNGTAATTAAQNAALLASLQACSSETGNTDADKSACLSKFLPSTSQATEGGLLSNPNLPALLSQLPDAGLANLAATNGPGALLSSMGSGGNVPTGAMDALAAIAEAAKKEAPQLASLLGMSSAASTYSGGSGSNSKSGGSDNSNPFGSLFGAKLGGAAGTGSPTGTNNFGKNNTDIWHTNTTLNLFQIISEKVGKVTSRVQ